MDERQKNACNIAVIAVACYVFIFSAVRYNLSVSAWAESEGPVTVVVDAGHGGEDGGAVSADGKKESELNLQIALRTEQLLALCGIKPLMLRSEDISLHHADAGSFSEKKASDLKNRVKAVESIPNAMLVSIHQNHFSQEKYKGAQVFYAQTPGSKMLAQQLQRCLRDTLDTGNDRSVKSADSIYLMRNISCCGVLVECGFLSNSAEAYLLQQENYQKKLVCALAAGLSRYLEGDRNFEV